MFSDDISSFYINLLSGCSLNYYPDNSLSKFKVKLPYNLKFLHDDNWHVAVTKFACTSIKHIQYVEQSKRRVIFKYINLVLVDNIIITELLQAVTKFLETIGDSSFFDRYINLKNELNINNFKNYKFIEVMTHHRKIKIPTQYAFTSKELFDYYFTQIPNKERVEHVDYLKKSFDNSKVPTLISSKMLAYYNTLISDYEPLNYLCLYTDIIKPHIIGDRMARSLYMHPIKNADEWTQRNVIDIKNVEYYPLEMINLSEINILIADETGDQINFHDSTFSTMVLLHFKKGI